MLAHYGLQEGAGDVLAKRKKRAVHNAVLQDLYQGKKNVGSAASGGVACVFGIWKASYTDDDDDDDGKNLWGLDLP